MRISSQTSSMDMTANVSSASKNTASTNIATNAQRQATHQASKPKVVDRPTVTEATSAQAAEGLAKSAANKEKLQHAVESLNEFMEDHMPKPTSSKFRFHEG